MNAFSSDYGTPPVRLPPANTEMEASVLGSILLNNATLEVVVGLLSADHFTEEIHRRIYEVSKSLIAAGQTATPITLRTFLGDHDLGGITIPQYLARICGESANPLAAKAYATGIHDLAVRRKVIGVAEKVLEQAYDLPVDTRPTQMVGEAIAELHELAAGDRATSTRLDAHAGAAEALDYIRRIAAGEIKPARVTTGFNDLDNATGGYQPGTLWVIGARPGMGKTVFAVTSSNKTSRRGWGVLDFSLEVPKEQMVARLLADQAFSSRQPITFQRIMNGDLAVDEIWRLEEAHERMLACPLTLDVASRLTPAEIRIRVRAERDRMARKGVALKVVFLDYLKQIAASDRYKGNRVYEVGEISYSLKQLAKDEGICVVLLAQLNRALEGRDDKRPSLSDLRESGDLEADADVVGFIHREAHYIEKSPEYRAGDAAATAAYIEARNKAEIIIGKNRAGPTRTVELWCDVSCSTMSDHVREERL